MTTQLVLLDNGAPPWRLDEATRAAGLRGVALARSALRDATRPTVPPASGEPGPSGERTDHATAA